MDGTVGGGVYGPHHHRWRHHHRLHSHKSHRGLACRRALPVHSQAVRASVGSGAAGGGRVGALAGGLRGGTRRRAWARVLVRLSVRCMLALSQRVGVDEMERYRRHHHRCWRVHRHRRWRVHRRRRVHRRWRIHRRDAYGWVHRRRVPTADEVSFILRTAEKSELQRDGLNHGCNTKQRRFRSVRNAHA